MLVNLRVLRGQVQGILLPIHHLHAQCCLEWDIDANSDCQKQDQRSSDCL